MSSKTCPTGCRQRAVCAFGGAALAALTVTVAASGSLAEPEDDAAADSPATMSSSETDEEPSRTMEAKAAFDTPERVAGDVEPAAADIASPDVVAEGEWDDFDDWAATDDAEGSSPRAWDFEIGGFVEALVAPRVVRSVASANEFVANEARFRLNLDAVHEIAGARFRGDLFADAVERRIWFDLRDVSVFVRGGNWFTLRVGRQVLTWGTGDFLFLNDLFPKDFNSFFIGRADEYLKAPSNSIVTTFTINEVGLDVVWTPIFEPDRFIDGDRLSFFNPLAGEVIGDRSDLTPVEPILPDERLRNGTFHGRLYGTVGAYELAAYGYGGFWPQPNAIDLAALNLTYARLAVYGASVRGPLGGGLFNLEVAYYDSFEDRAGTDPTIPNSQFRGLMGYEREILPKFQMGLQYYLEAIIRYDELIANSLFPEFEPNEVRHILTLRLTQLLVMDNLELSFFMFFSPDELDTYLRPRLTYKIVEPLAFVVGANLMFGRDDFTFFGQLQQNSNAYVRFRYSF